MISSSNPEEVTFTFRFVLGFLLFSINAGHFSATTTSGVCDADFR
jgi:hypothetical protein